MTDEFLSTINLVQSGREMFHTLEEDVKVATEKISIVQRAWDLGVFSAPRCVIDSIRARGLLMMDVFHCTKESIEDAEKELATAVRFQSEGVIALAMEYEKEYELSCKGVDRSIAMVGRRSSEAIAFTELCTARIEELKIPRLYEK